MKTDIAKITEEIKELAKKFPEVTRKVCYEYMELIVQEVKAEVVQLTPKGVGGSAGLIGSIFSEARKLPNGVQGIVGSPLEYAEVIEYGRKPGSKMPPLEPIALWAQRKLGLDFHEAQEIAFGIARNIAKFGFLTHPKGARMFEQGYQNAEPAINQLVSMIPAEILRRVQ